MVFLNFEVARQAWSARLCVPMQAVRRAEDGQQHLSVLVHSVWELCRCVYTLGGGLQQVSRTENQAYI